LDHLTIIGKSRTGASIAKALRLTKRTKLDAISPARSKIYPKVDSEVIIVATKDEKIAEVAKKALRVASKKLNLMVHLAGSLPSTILPKQPGVMRLTLHPLQTFSKPEAALLRGIYWMASSDDPKAIRWARQFVADLGGKGVIVLAAEQLPVYHAMTVFGSNFITLLFEAIEEISESLGQNSKRMKAALRPLAGKALQNVLTEPANEVLTGPIKRKDFATIEKHQKALKALDPKLRAIYDAFLTYALESGTPKR
jgi:predicted short-subunit dehydrogenase-like oxidoreductase (DUF2520 family)